MKTFRKYFDILIVAKYLALTILFLVFNRLEKVNSFYSSAILVASLYEGSSIIFTCFLYILSFIIVGDFGFCASASIFSGLFIIIMFIYKKIKHRANYELLLYTLFGLCGFIFLGNTSYYIPIEKRLLSSLLTIILTFLSMIAFKAINEKNLKYKLGFDEFFSISIITAVFGLGLSNLISPYLWKAVSLLLILICCYILRTGLSTIISCVLSLSLAVYYNNIDYVSLFLVYSLIISSLMPLSRYASALAVIGVDYLMEFVFGIYGAYTLPDFISILCGSVAFCLIPKSFLSSVKDKLYLFREKQLVRQSINRNRTLLSAKLYDLSNVFTEMSDAFTTFKNNSLTDDGVKREMVKGTFSDVCRQCDNYMKCVRFEGNIMKGLTKMADIGFAKGKLSLIDLPKELSSCCIHPNNIMFKLNKLLGEYRLKMVENINVSNGRDLIAKEASGVSDILRSLALETGTLLKYHSRLERILSDKLFKAGFIINELLIFGEDKMLSVSIITAMSEFSVLNMGKIISSVLNMEMELADKSNITENKCYLLFRKSVVYEAVFGIANAKKDGSLLSGDTHSATRISRDKFMVALSDGMGSGENAENVSSSSLSLIESFYKAGINGELILNTVNKLLSINTEDTFTALDITIIDLNTCQADFIKYGSPYGFIINDNGIKIVEGNSLPLGILDELKPSVASSQLNGGDMILLITDGISDSFRSSSAVIDFLRTVPAKNPQTLADDILTEAVRLNGGKHNDDMTALAVRVYKKI